MENLPLVKKFLHQKDAPLPQTSPESPKFKVKKRTRDSKLCRRVGEVWKILDSSSCIASIEEIETLEAELIHNKPQNPTSMNGRSKGGGPVAEAVDTETHQDEIESSPHCVDLSERESLEGNPTPSIEQQQLAEVESMESMIRDDQYQQVEGSSTKPQTDGDPSLRENNTQLTHWANLGLFGNNRLADMDMDTGFERATILSSQFSSYTEVEDEDYKGVSSQDILIIYPNEVHMDSGRPGTESVGMPSSRKNVEQRLDQASLSTDPPSITSLGSSEAHISFSAMERRIQILDERNRYCHRLPPKPFRKRDEEIANALINDVDLAPQLALLYLEEKCNKIERKLFDQLLDKLYRRMLSTYHDDTTESTEYEESVYPIYHHNQLIYPHCFKPSHHQRMKGLRDNHSIEGWFQGRKQVEFLVQYGLVDDPLFELIPENGLDFSPLETEELQEHMHSLTGLQNCWFSKPDRVWWQGLRAINIAWSQSTATTTVWVQLNNANSIWVSRSCLESFRVGDGPLGKKSTMDLMMTCVKKKRDRYVNAGFSKEAEQFYRTGNSVLSAILKKWSAKRQPAKKPAAAVKPQSEKQKEELSVIEDDEDDNESNDGEEMGSLR